LNLEGGKPGTLRDVYVLKLRHCLAKSQSRKLRRIRKYAGEEGGTEKRLKKNGGSPSQASYRDDLERKKKKPSKKKLSQLGKRGRVPMVIRCR